MSKEKTGKQRFPDVIERKGSDLLFPVSMQPFEATSTKELDVLVKRLCYVRMDVSGNGRKTHCFYIRKMSAGVCKKVLEHASS